MSEDSDEAKTLRWLKEREAEARAEWEARPVVLLPVVKLTPEASAKLEARFLDAMKRLRLR